VIYYVFSGTLKGVEVDASGAIDAVEKAVFKQGQEVGNCLLGPAIRVSIERGKGHPYDVFFAPPYEEQFPALFTEDIDVQKIGVEQE
jgi:hypothetical protein